MDNRSRLFVYSLLAILASMLFACKGNSDKSAIKTEVVNRGPVVASFKCPGSVGAGNVVSVLNPLRNSVVAVYKMPGEQVKKGELIMQLDKTQIQDEISSLNNQLLQKQNALEKNRLNARSIQLDLNQSEQAKKARVENMKHSLEQQEKLLEAGGTSQARVDQIKQNLALAESDLNNQAEKNSIRLQQLEMDERNLELQIASFKKSLSTQRAILQKTDVKAPVSGILLELAGNVGDYVSLDGALVTIADENTSKIVGTAGKNKLGLIHAGGEVEVLVNGEKFMGTIGQVYDDENSESVSFDVFIAENDQQKLNDVENVELLVKANDKENVLRIRKLPGMTLSQHFDVLLQKDDEVIRTEIVLGTIGKDYCEIISGVNEGDVILVKDPSTALVQ
ncbi:efflux RND transporter periplasmic adaptor subunit [Draconibacterium halophilum]|uniref:HlyD family efflux transporter periplasmic adaptor subunit n=1 Tax=Draconibacterium halophilum TaxID=2706887 RepID=A0A6C0RAH8_9BACT|nr:HlyD family efflux transporter periplasmic adaptor subunit [Draconibacterium halophilum]QIA07099.1 HlyD family efflux transporter periplasmic adaptor subunit [Draconibacterium halophilum]